MAQVLEPVGIKQHAFILEVGISGDINVHRGFLTCLVRVGEIVIHLLNIEFDKSEDAH